MTLVYLVAGEQSGDILGARLMAALRSRRPDIQFAGIGGAGMAQQGFSSLFPMHELALMGFLEVLPNLLRLRQRMAQTVADIAARRPAVVVTIDSPGFTLRLLRRIAPLGVRRVHYVAPQVWAWRESRVRGYPGLWDQLLCLLPFEQNFFARHGLPARFVGHPVLESGADRGDGQAFRTRHDIPPGARVVSILPGSRRTETRRLLPILGETLRMVPDVVPVVPVAEAVAEAVRAGTANWPRPPILVTAEKFDAFAASDAALTKSGTATLELALAGVPMLVTYKVNQLSAALARYLLTVPYASLLNLLSDPPPPLLGSRNRSDPAGQAALVPEFLQNDCRPDRLADALSRLLTDPAAATMQRSAFPQVLASLRPPGGLNPSEAAADAVLALVEL